MHMGVRRLRSIVTAVFFVDTSNKFWRHLIVDVRTWFHFWVPSLSDWCAPVFECIYAFCDEHSLIRSIVYCSTVGNLHKYVQWNQYCYCCKVKSFYLWQCRKSVNKCGACCSCCCSFLSVRKMQDWQTLCCGIRQCRRDTKKQRVQFVSPKCCSLCRYQSCCCCSFWHNGFE